jgi:hypothetical protein
VEATKYSDFEWVDFQRVTTERTEKKKKSKTATELRRVYYASGKL